VGAMAALLLLLVLCAYFIVWRSARRADQPFHDYIARNFRYLRLLSFAGDLFVKFAVLSLVIWHGNPEWMIPLLVLFVGDYLIQGRFFQVPFPAALLLGLACFATAAGLFLSETDRFEWALGVFLAVDLVSIVATLRSHLLLRRATTTAP